MSKTTLVPAGIPGQPYGSFAGKEAAVAAVIVTPDCRTLDVPDEDRLFDVPVEDRVFEVECN